VEKPIFNSLREFEKIWPSLVRYPGTIMVAENLHFAPFHRRLKHLLQGGRLGRPLFLDLYRFGRSQPEGWRADPEQMPLGALHEGGVHWVRRLLDLASVFEENGSPGVVGVRAYRPQVPLTEMPGDDTMMVVARHRSGLVSRLFHTWGIPRRSVLFDVSKFQLEGGTLYFDSRGIFGRLVTNRRKKFMWPSIRDAAGFKAMWQHFVYCLENRQKPELSIETIFGDFAYLEAAYRSLESGKEENPEARQMVDLVEIGLHRQKLVDILDKEQPYEDYGYQHFLKEIAGKKFVPERQEESIGLLDSLFRDFSSDPPSVSLVPIFQMSKLFVSINRKNEGGHLVFNLLRRSIPTLTKYFDLPQYADFVPLYEDFIRSALDSIEAFFPAPTYEELYKQMVYTLLIFLNYHRAESFSRVLPEWSKTAKEEAVEIVLSALRETAVNQPLTSLRCILLMRVGCLYSRRLRDLVDESVTRILDFQATGKDINLLRELSRDPDQLVRKFAVVPLVERHELYEPGELRIILNHLLRDPSEEVRRFAEHEIIRANLRHLVNQTQRAPEKKESEQE